MKIQSKLRLKPDEKRLGENISGKVEKAKYKVGGNVAGNKRTTSRKLASNFHKDTKSHNVNIRVVSGINGNLISDIKNKLDTLNKWNIILDKLNTDLKKDTVTKLEKTLIRNDIYRVKNIIKDLKTDISKTQKKVK